MIRYWHQMPHLQKRGIRRMLLEAIGGDSGSIVYPPMTEPDQRRFDYTCKLLHRFPLPWSEAKVTILESGQKRWRSISEWAGASRVPRAYSHRYPLDERLPP
jgi:hypothetical protein